VIKISGNPVCHKCSRKIVLGYSVKDELWAKLPKKWNSGSVLCLECFIEEIEKKNPTQKITLNDFYFLAIIGDYDHNDFGGMILESDFRKNRRIEPLDGD
jgi:hypothetical protein